MKPKKPKSRTAIDTTTVGGPKQISELVRDASGRIAQVLVVVDSSMSDPDRRQLEQAAQELRHVLEYLDR